MTDQFSEERRAKVIEVMNTARGRWNFMLSTSI